MKEDENFPQKKKNNASTKSNSNSLCIIILAKYRVLQGLYKNRKPPKGWGTQQTIQISTLLYSNCSHIESFSRDLFPGISFFFLRTRRIHRSGRRRCLCDCLLNAPGHRPPARFRWTRCRLSPGRWTAGRLALAACPLDAAAVTNAQANILWSADVSAVQRCQFDQRTVRTQGASMFPVGISQGKDHNAHRRWCQNGPRARARGKHAGREKNVQYGRKASLEGSAKNA